jgi:transcriptional regulator with AAA-type ATPase domain
MAIFTSEEHAFADTISRLSYANPFLTQRIEWEREALGDEFVDSAAVWSKRTDTEKGNPNTEKIKPHVDALMESVRERLTLGGRFSTGEQRLYENLVLFHLYHRFDRRFPDSIVEGTETRAGKQRIVSYPDFLAEAEPYFKIRAVRLSIMDEFPHLFACFFQLRRAFFHIFNSIIGQSMPAARLRSAVWQSIFTHDMERYRRALYSRMGDVTCLISGPTGTGKELVARAISMSRYIPFDPETRTFAESVTASFFPLNLSALSPTLIESELFGHRRGAFTGALVDRPGWFEVCPTLGTVFLDEIGDTDASIQVKLLRVLETRRFQRLGDTEDRAFRGKLMAATNRDLAREMGEGRFRQDLYYRLCSDMIVTPSLREQIQDSPRALADLILFICRRLIGEEEAPALVKETEGWIEQHLGPDYEWPGNVRELEQCVRNILIRKEYHPPKARPRSLAQELVYDTANGSLTADELLRRYCTLVYAQTGTYQETARRLDLDHRTVKAKIDRSLLEKYRTGR